MRLHYISPSTLPSRSANSVHVPRQCEGLVRAGADVTLYAKRSIRDRALWRLALKEQYGLDPASLHTVSYYSASARAVNLRIAALALATLNARGWPDAILSRNLYASYAIAVLQRRPVLFETHQLELGLRKAMQAAILRSPQAVTLVISHKLGECLEEYHGARPRRMLVLHDAAAEGIEPLAPERRRAALQALAPHATGKWDIVCGYFGHLYPGRGIEVIEHMARERPQCLFLVYGGNEGDVTARRDANRLRNLFFGGHVPHPLALELMRAVDVLLMPYQETVSIGIEGHDTARWMSPMKMFEYLASGVPIISSDLPSLREVLRDGVNCTLAPAADPHGWVAALDALGADRGLAASLGARGHETYRAHHTWTQRGRRILEAAASL
jgi:glycosyltransferase involved in cell wall biosynthesis